MLAAIGRVMQQKRIAALPRNYDLLFAAMSGSNPDIARAVLALGEQPSQADIDRIAFEHGRTQDGAFSVKIAFDIIDEHIETLSATLSDEVQALQALHVLLNNILLDLNGEPTGSADPVLSGKRMEALEAAIEKAIEQTQSFNNKIVTTRADLARLRRRGAQIRTCKEQDQKIQLANRATFRQQLEALYEPPLTVIKSALFMVSIDHFKQLNETHGFGVGERVLDLVTRALRKGVKQSDIVARIGGNEFALILHDTNETAARAIASRLGRRVEGASPPDSRAEKALAMLTLSIGIAMRNQADTANELHYMAQTALSAARNEGTGLIRVYDPSMSERQTSMAQS